MTRRRAPDWPGLMKPATARAYLDGMAADRFAAEVAPHLQRRTVAGELHYTRRSIDDWIDRGDAPGKARTPADLLRMLDDDESGGTVESDELKASLVRRSRGRRSPAGHRSLS